MSPPNENPPDFYRPGFPLCFPPAARAGLTVSSYPQRSSRTTPPPSGVSARADVRNPPLEKASGTDGQGEGSLSAPFGRQDAGTQPQAPGCEFGGKTRTGTNNRTSAWLR
jgi:hypothetical protein